MNKKIIIATIATFVSTFAITANASNIFSKLDIDGNGSLDKKEASYMPSLDSQWDALDADTNGKLSVNEFAKYKTDETTSRKTVEMKIKNAPSK